MCGPICLSRVARLLAVTYVTMIAAPALAEPQINQLSLRGLQIGGTTRLTINGAELGPETRLLLPIPVAAQTVEGTATDKQVTLSVTLPADVPSGIYPLRVANRRGVSAMVLVGVDALPQLPLAEQTASLPAALHGTLSGATRTRTTFTGKQGERLVADVEARRLGGKLDPVLRLYNSRGVQIAYSQAIPSAQGDARLDVTLPADGQYTIELHDVLFRAAAPGHFRLKLGNLQYADFVFPSAAQRGAEVAVEPVRTSLADNVKGSAHAVGNGAAPITLPADVHLTGLRPAVSISDHAEAVEAEPSAGPQTVGAPPVGISGRLTSAGQEDVYRVPVTPGEKLKFELVAAQLGSPLDGVLSLRNEQNAQLAASDDQQTTMDPAQEFTIPAGVSAIHVAVKDLLGRGGADFIYHLKITPASLPAVVVTAETDRVSLAAGAPVVVPINAERRAFDGAIKLDFSGLPAGTIVSNAELPAGTSRALVTLIASDPNAPPALARLSLTAPGAAAAPATLAKLGGATNVPLWLRDQLAVAVAEPAPIVLAWKDLPTPMQLVLGRTQTLKVGITRAAGSEGPLRLSLVTSQDVPKKTVKQDNKDVQVEDMVKALRLAEMPTLAADATEATLTLLTPPDLPLPSYDFAVKAERLSADGKKVLATFTTPAVRCATVAPPAEAPLALLEDEADRVAALNQGTGTAELHTETKFSGTASVKVAGQQRFNPALANVALKIREFPAEGEYRFVRFAWKKQAGEAVALQIAHDGKFGPEKDGAPSFRYHAGPAEKVFDASIRVNDKIPADWTVVTRDLFADFGEFTLTGLSLAPIDGEFALFDHIYLGRSPADFDLVAPARQ